MTRRFDKMMMKFIAEIGSPRIAKIHAKPGGRNVELRATRSKIRLDSVVFFFSMPIADSTVMDTTHNADRQLRTPAKPENRRDLLISCFQKPGTVFLIQRDHEKIYILTMINEHRASGPESSVE
ncbi:unnamed protein product [Soboliphyme baturini]|uniref:Ribosome-associated protein n=1 Tax=Soboliphyme baturini TaxID=241478 RepID=A0A183IDU6_9BILA|nr:unnamed protein product [Soboliphyme baturini]